MISCPSWGLLQSCRDHTFIPFIGQVAYLFIIIVVTILFRVSFFAVICFSLFIQMMYIYGYYIWRGGIAG